MGSLDINSDQKVLEPELETTINESESMLDNSPTTSDKSDLLELMSEPSSASDGEFNELIINSPTALDEENPSCSSSLSSTDFMLEDPFQDSDNEHVEKTNWGIDNTTESPPIQVMERSVPTTQAYRIPSSVFARKESTNNPGWGMPSNESLFSIQMGGMSFRNQDSLVLRSVDLEPLSPSGKPIDVEMIPELDETGQSRESDASDKNLEFSNEGRSHKLGEEDKIHSLSDIANDHGLSITNDPVNPNLQGDQGNESVVEELNSHFAAESGRSRSSFAFPILTADIGKGPSARINSTAKTDPETEKLEPELETQPPSEPDKQAQSSETKADPPVTTWTKCFGCCTFCS